MSEQERNDLLGALAKHRELFRFTVQGLTDEQAALTPTDSALCLGGLIKHVAFVESGWVDFIVEGTKAMEASEGGYDAHTNSFRMLEGETLAGILADYEKVTNRTDDVLATVDLDPARKHANKWRDAGFGYLVCGWPGAGASQVEAFAREVMPDLV